MLGDYQIKNYGELDNLGKCALNYFSGNHLVNENECVLKIKLFQAMRSYYIRPQHSQLFNI